VEADSSDAATRAVISQQLAEDVGKWHPIAFFPKSFSPVEWNYEIHDKEMLVIIHALEEWRDFLECAPCRFELWTDHKNLEYFRTSKKLNRRQAWWSLYLSWFNFMLQHQPGHPMGKPDSLSHHVDHGSRSRDNSDINQVVTLYGPDGPKFDVSEDPVPFIQCPCPCYRCKLSSPCTSCSSAAHLIHLPHLFPSPKHDP
jgi:RNase H-like domain found in reverse transcriptase